MKESYWAYLIVILGIFIIVVMMLIQNYTSTGEEDYYLTKEVMEAAMLDAVDYGVYAKYGEIRIIESKFVENFIRRFADSVNNSKNYTIDFYEIYESPPKATVMIKTKTGDYTVTTDTTANFDIITTLSGIIGTKYANSKAYEVKMTVYNGKANYDTKLSTLNGNAVFSLTPNEGYDTLTNVMCNGSTDNIKVENNKVTINNVTSDLECTASYENTNLYNTIY